MIDALRAAEPLGEVCTQHYPVSAWRRYDKTSSLPDGLLVIGDAVCSFNPVYGQGMTSAALQARALRHSLSLSLATMDAEDMGRRYFRTAAKLLAPMWQANRLNDFARTPTSGWRSVSQWLVIWFTEKLAGAAADDIVVTEALMRLVQLLDPPAALLRPTLLMRVFGSSVQSRSTTRR